MGTYPLWEQRERVDSCLRKLQVLESEGEKAITEPLKEKKMMKK